MRAVTLHLVVSEEDFPVLEQQLETIIDDEEDKGQWRNIVLDFPARGDSPRTFTEPVTVRIDSFGLEPI